MHLSGLIPLYRSMREQDIGRCKFRYQVNHLTFDCLFFTDIQPFELVMGCLGHNFAIFLDVQQGFNIKPYIDDTETFYALLNALRTHHGADHQLNLKEFFQAFNEHIPETTNPNNVVIPADVIRYYSDIEEADKVYFCGWLDNNQQGHRVSEANLYKTRRLLGQRAFEFAERRNQSTRWTHEQHRAIDLDIPN